MPHEILENILLQLGISPSELFGLSLVSRKWRSTIKKEQFLNKFFHHRFASRHSIPNPSRVNRGGDGPIYQEDLGSSSLLLERTIFHTCPIDPFPTNSFSISCWMWVPNTEYRLDLFVQSRLSNQYLGFTIVSSSRFFSVRTLTNSLCTREGLLDDAWTHIVLNNNRNGTCSLFLNGHKCRLESDSSANTQGHRPEGESLSVVHYSEINSSVCRMNYLRLFPFCLTQGEIQAAYEHGCSSFDEIQMGRYWTMRAEMGGSES
jgi:hypothetical protein